MACCFFAAVQISFTTYRILVSRVVGAAVFLLASCSRYPGYEELDSGIYKKYLGFDDCEPRLADAEFFVMQVNWKRWNAADSGSSFQLHHGGLRNFAQISSAIGEPVGLRLMNVLDSMFCGDHISLVLPYSEFVQTYLCAYCDTTAYLQDDAMQLDIHLQKTFDRHGYLEYLSNAAQQGEMSEEDAIELYLMNSNTQFEKLGSCFISLIRETQGDSVKAGREITIEYTTHLFNGKALDTLTSMQFQFGKPGQILGGFQYALSLLKEGEHAKIYLPSALAFGEGGNSNGLVPARTPVCFDVKVLEVKTP